MKISGINNSYKIHALQFGSQNLPTKTVCSDTIKDSFENSNETKTNNSFIGNLISVFKKQPQIQNTPVIIKKKQLLLPEHIDFEPVKNIEEAKLFAKEKLNIKSFNVNNPQIMNYALEGLSNAVNITKGNIKLPQQIKEINGNIFWQAATNNNCIFINNEVTPIEYFIYFTPHTSPDFLNKYKNADFLTRIDFINDIEKERGALTRNKFHIIYHELGHINHKYQNPKKAKEYSVIDVLDNEESLCNIIEDNPVIKNHFSLCNKLSSEEQAKVGYYGMLYPNEYVADLYAYMMSGQKFANKFMKIYNTYGGPKINQ